MKGGALLTNSIKLVSTFVATIMLLIICMTFASCSNKRASFNSSAEVFGFAGATASTLLAVGTSQQSFTNNIISTAQQQYIEVFDKYCDAFARVVGKNAITSSKKLIENSNYNCEINVVTTDLNSNKETLTLQFLEINADKTPVQSLQDGINTTFEGTLNKDNTNYAIYGQKTIDNGYLQANLTVSYDSSSFVNVVYNENSRKFEYSIYNNNALMDTFNVVYKLDDDNLVLTLAVTNNGNEYLYYLEREGNKLKVTYDNSSNKEVIYCKSSDDGTQYTYTFTDNTQITKNNS